MNETTRSMQQSNPIKVFPKDMLLCLCKRQYALSTFKNHMGSCDKRKNGCATGVSRDTEEAKTEELPKEATALWEKASVEAN